MVWRSCLAAGLALLACATAQAQDAASYDPVVTQHKLKLQKRTIDYTASAGLMPIRLPGDDKLIGDMFYVAYTAKPKAGETRPVAFIWNGGSGANSTPLHYGAFGPKRLAKGTLKPNEATLLDVADIVFLDQIETGFGRYSPDITPRLYLNQQADARTFGSFIESYLRDHGGPQRPAFLIGESYGVRRAQLVAEDLLTRGIDPEGLVLISGYILVGKKLDPAAEGAFRLPGYAALAWSRGMLAGSPWKSEIEIHDAALAWSRDVLKKTQQADTSAEIDFTEGLKRFFGYSNEAISAPTFPLKPEATPRSLVNLGARHAPLLFKDIQSPISYDMRNQTSDNREWISQAIIDDLRKDLGFNPPSRVYVGQEYDDRGQQMQPFMPRQNMRVQRADGTIVELSPETMDQFPELQGTLPFLTQRSVPAPWKPADGLAPAIVNFSVHFGASLSLAKSPMPALMASAPDMEIFVAGGMFDDLVSCAIGEEMTRRDLAAASDRVRTQCYAGGHMMYDDEKVGAVLSEDVRDFIRDVQSGVAVTP